LLKLESDLVYAPCRHGKMIVVSHSPINTVITEHPRQLFHIVTPRVTLFLNYLSYKLNPASSVMVNQVIEVWNQNSKSGVRI
jgi:hypothetical protein